MRRCSVPRRGDHIYSDADSRPDKAAGVGVSAREDYSNGRPCFVLLAPSMMIIPG